VKVGRALEDYARILDHLPQGHPDRSKYHREPLAYALGEDEFKLFELTPKESATITIGDHVYIGKDIEKRDVIQHVKRRVGYEELTTAAQNEVSFVIGEIIKEKEDKFIRFFNEAQAITTRFHMLELLPGLGKKTMWAILEERKKGPFKSFEDLAKRVSTIHHPEKLLAKRIEQEISNPGEKYHLFVAR
jgi:putative nucleotide binding protein